jgi:hypothetical protein
MQTDIRDLEKLPAVSEDERKDEQCL